MSVYFDEEFYQLAGDLNLTNDVIFKAVFGRETDESKMLLMDLVNAVLNLDGAERIVSIEHQNPFNYQEFYGDKLSILDIKATTGRGVQLNIEMQVNEQSHYMQRSLYYWAKLFSGQMVTGQRYDSIKKTIGIHFVDHVMFEQPTEAHEIHRVYNSHHRMVTDLLELHYIQMPLVDAIIREKERALFNWVTFMKEVNQRDKRYMVESIISEKDVMEVALWQFKKATANDILRHQAEARQKAEFDYQTNLYAAEQKGLARGHEEGLAKGLEEGLVEGKRDAMAEMAVKMKNRGMTNLEISELTGLSLEEIEHLGGNDGDHT